jgi:hypothetical protein
MTDAGAMAAATDPPSLPVAAGLQCTLCSSAGDNDDETSSNIKLELFFRPDETKKSVFWLDAPDPTTADSQSVDAPAHCYIEHCHSTIFFLGGFQLVSNAKTVEIYIVSADSNNKEEYLTTSRGIPSQETPGSFKVMCVVPGGPRPIVRLHLKLLSLKPAPPSTESVSMAKLVSIKLTARIPQAPAVSVPQSTSTIPAANNDTSTAPSLASMMANTSTTLPNQQLQAPGPTMDDVGAAMAGVSFMVRSTEERLVEAMQVGFSRLHTAAQQNSQNSQTVDMRLQVLQQTVVQQSHMLERQHATMQQQHMLLEQQGQALETLKQQQQDLLIAFESMQTQFVTTDTPPPPRTESEPGIVEVTVASATNLEEIDEGPLEVLETDTVQVEEVVINDHPFGESSEDTLDESDVVFVENDDATSSSTCNKEPATHDSEELHLINDDDAPALVDGGEGSDELILVTDDE